MQVDADDVLYSPRATLVARHHDTEPIGGKQRFAVAFIRQQDLRVAEVRRDLAEGKQNFVAVAAGNGEVMFENFVALEFF